MAKTNEKLEQLVRIIKEIPVSKIIETRIPVHSQGKNNALAICPFHGDKNLGSFKISDTKGIWKCFSCEAAGDGASFIAKYDKISYTQALLRIAKEFDILKSEDEKSFSSAMKGFDFSEFKNSNQKEVLLEVKEASPKMKDYVYRILMQGPSLIDESKMNLSSEHKALLLQRGISEKNIRKYGYFTFPSRYAMKKINILIKKRGYKETDLLGVPGFYQNKVTGKVTFTALKGIGLPLTDVDGKIIGIQVRRDETSENQSRYIWFSSGFAFMHLKYQKGVSPGSPINVIYPSQTETKSLFITEGHFKAAFLTEKFNSTSLALQGIGNWKGIETVVKKIIAKQPKIKFLYIAFDGDISYNLQVYFQASKLSRFLKKEFPGLILRYLLWDDKYGKGIDDVIASHNEKHLFSLSRKTFETNYNDFLFFLMKEVDTFDLKKVSLLIQKKYKEDSSTFLKENCMKFIKNPTKL
ncbi:MAG: CHC2 zinc finger domain-containing protein [Erysipelotrichaceae bacterium]